MSKLTAPTEALRLTQVMKAMVFYLNGDTKAIACEKAKISQDIFDAWSEQAMDVIEKYQANFMQVQQNRLLLVASAEARILDRLIQKAELETDPAVLIKVLNYLGVQRKELEAKLGAVVTHTNADQFLEDLGLRGPSTQVESSKMIEKQKDPLRFNIAPQPDGSVDITVPRRVEILDLNPDEFKHLADE